MSERAEGRRDKVAVTTVVWALLTALIFSAAFYLGES